MNGFDLKQARRIAVIGGAAALYVGAGQKLFSAQLKKPMSWIMPIVTIGVATAALQGTGVIPGTAEA